MRESPHDFPGKPEGLVQVSVGGGYTRVEPTILTLGRDLILTVSGGEDHVGVVAGRWVSGCLHRQRRPREGCCTCLENILPKDRA